MDHRVAGQPSAASRSQTWPRCGGRCLHTVQRPAHRVLQLSVLSSGYSLRPLRSCASPSRRALLRALPAGSSSHGPSDHQPAANPAAHQQQQPATKGEPVPGATQQQHKQPPVQTWRGLPELVAKHVLKLAADDVHELLLELPQLLVTDPVASAKDRQEFESMYRHLLRSVQLGARGLSQQQLVDVLRVTTALPPPGDYWLRSWCVLTLPLLRDMALEQLLDAAMALLYHQHHPGRSWAASFLACVQAFEAELAENDMAVVFQAVMAWQLRPVAAMRRPLLQLVHRSIAAAGSTSDLATILQLVSYLDGRVEPELQRAVLSRAEQLLTRCGAQDLQKLLQLLQQHGIPLRVDPEQLAAAVEPQLGTWQIDSVAKLLQQMEGAGLQLPPGFLARSAQHALQLLPSAGIVQQVQLLRAFAAVGYTPPQEQTEKWLSQTLEGLQQMSWQARLGLCPTSSLPAAAGHNLSSSMSASSLEDDHTTTSRSSSSSSHSSSSSSSSSSSHSSSSSSSSGRASGGLSGAAGGGFPRAGGGSSDLQHGYPLLSSTNDTDTAPDCACSWLLGPSVIVATTLDLLGAAARLQLPIEPSWVLECLACLEGCGQAIAEVQLQQLLVALEQLDVTPEASWCDTVVQEWSVDLVSLAPQQQLGLLRLLVRCQCRPASVWWNKFMLAIEQRMAEYTMEQLSAVISYLSESDMGGRPPQAWLNSHEQHLLHHAPDLTMGQWSVNLACYSSLMYRPSQAFVIVLEQYTAAGLHRCAAGELVPIVTAVARLQLPFSDFWEQQLLRGVGQMLPEIDSELLSKLVRGLSELEVEMPDPQLQQLLEATQQLLPELPAPAICCLLRYLSKHSSHSPHQLLPGAIGALQQQLPQLDAPAMLQLLQALKAAEFTPPRNFMAAADLQLQLLLPRMDAPGLATAMEDVVGLGHTPSRECQEVLAGCRTLRKGLARPSQGLGPAPLWTLLAAVARFDGAPLPVLLQELVPQVTDAFAVAPAEEALQVLPTVLGALASWEHYTPTPHQLASLLLASEPLLHQLPSAAPALHFAERCVALRAQPPLSWMRAASERALGAGGGWGGLSREQLLLVLGRWAALRHKPNYLPGWPNLLYARCHQLVQSLTPEQACSALQAFAVLSLPVPLPLLQALEQCIGPRLVALAPAQVAAAAHALHRLAHLPGASWWSACVAASSGPAWEGYNGTQACQLVCAVADWQRPEPSWVAGALRRVQQDLDGMEGAQLLDLVGVLYRMEYRPQQALLQPLGAAAVAAARACDDPQAVAKVQAMLAQMGLPSG